MGQKTHPIGFRLGVIRTWNSRWYASKPREYAAWLHEDIKVYGIYRLDIVDRSYSSADSVALNHASLEHPVEYFQSFLHCGGQFKTKRIEQKICGSPFCASSC